MCSFFFRAAVAVRQRTPRRTKQRPNGGKQQREAPPKRNAKHARAATPPPTRNAKNNQNAPPKHPTERTRGAESGQTTRHEAPPTRRTAGKEQHRQPAKKEQRRSQQHPTATRKNQRATKQTNEKRNGKTTRGTPPKQKKVTRDPRTDRAAKRRTNTTERSDGGRLVYI